MEPAQAVAESAICSSSGARTENAPINVGSRVDNGSEARTAVLDAAADRGPGLRPAHRSAIHMKSLRISWPRCYPAAPAAAPAPAPESAAVFTDWKAARSQAFSRGVLNTFRRSAIGMAATGLNARYYHGSQQRSSDGDGQRASPVDQATEQEVTPRRKPPVPVISRQVGGGWTV